MAPDFLRWLGLPSSGVAFELVVWWLVLSLGLLLGYREVRGGRSPKTLSLGWITGAALVGVGGWRWFHVYVYDALFFGVGGLILPTYGVLMIVGFLAGLVVLVDEARRVPGRPNLGDILDLSFWVVIGSLLGARLLFLLTRVGIYATACGEAARGEGPWGSCFAWLRIWEGGLVFYGGFLGALLAGWLWCRKHKVDYLAACDRFVPALAIGHAIGRIGCVAAGCCFGARGHGGVLVEYPFGSGAFHHHLHHATEAERAVLLERLVSLPVHATQFYEAIGEFILFVGLVFFLRPRKRYHGQLLAWWLGAYGVLRIVLELFRDDPIRGFLFRWEWVWLSDRLGVASDTVTLLSTSQAISLALLGAALVVGRIGRHRRDSALRSVADSDKGEPAPPDATS